MSQDLSVTMPQITLLPLDELFVPSWNPRKYIDPVEQANLRAFIEKGGKVRRIEVLKADKGWWIISGQRRMLAFRDLKKTHIEAEIMDITLAEAKIMAETSNEGVKPYWLDNYENWETLKDENRWTIRELADELGKDKSVVNRAVQVMSLLNPASRAMIREDLEAQKALFLNGLVSGGDKDVENKGKLWEFNQESARNLIPLLTGRSVEEAQVLAQEAIKTILQDHLPAAKVKALVAKSAVSRPQAKKRAEPVQAGDPADSVKGSAQYDPGPQQIAEANGQVPQAAPSAHANGIDHPPLAQPKPVAPLEALQQAPGHAAIPKHLSEAGHTGQMSETESLIWGEAAGISIISRIKAKVKKGERPSFFEALLLAAHALGAGLAWLGKHTWKIAKPVGKFVWKIVKNSLKGLLKALGRTVYNVVRVALGLAVLALLGWFGWEVYRNGFHPRRALMEIGKTLWEWTVLLWRQG